MKSPASSSPQLWAGVLCPAPGTAGWDRTLPGSGEPQEGGASTSSLNLILIVGFALLITFLARWLSTRGPKK